LEENLLHKNTTCKDKSETVVKKSDSCFVRSFGIEIAFNNSKGR